MTRILLQCHPSLDLSFPNLQPLLKELLLLLFKVLVDFVEFLLGQVLEYFLLRVDSDLALLLIDDLLLELIL